MATEPANEIRSVSDLVMRIRDRGAVRIVGIEGFCLSGKTHLGKELAAQLNARLVSTDCFVASQDGDTYYVDGLNLYELKKVISEALRLSQSVVLEGICLRDVISRMAPLTADLYIYVKVLSGQSGEETWHDGSWLEDFEKGCCETTMPEPHLSANKYHKNTRPHEYADLIYVRQEGPER